MKKHDQREPCGNCPFLRSAPLAHWTPEHYLMLAEIESNEGALGSNVFACHKYKDPEQSQYCVGWLLDQRRKGTTSLSLRFDVYRNADAYNQYKECKPPNGDMSLMYDDVQELVIANLEHDAILHPERYEDDEYE